MLEAVQMGLAHGEEVPVFHHETELKRPLSQAEQVRKYLEQHPADRSLSLRSLAARTGVSYSTVRRVLLETDSIGPGQADAV